MPSWYTVQAEYAKEHISKLPESAQLAWAQEKVN